MERVSWGLSEHQLAIGDRVIAEESAKREHLVVYLSGAHAYGFPSPDSDLDLKCIHVAPTGALVGFEPPPFTYDRAEVIEGVEIDYTSNELGQVLGGILTGNGNYLERVLGATFMTPPGELLASLSPLVRAVVSRRVHRHYRGFAANQQRELAKTPTVKKLLYVLRTAMTGTHLLTTGELETDLRVLAPRYGLADLGVDALIAAKRAGERAAADPAMLTEWEPRLAGILSAVDRARDTSPLPEEPPPDAVRALETWLVATRRARFAPTA
ncbi:MAG: nucleotidyltransferase domain-containing protein [Labilithrix sp.]|nr:nucleotidyltransferase domain-containing protein [Labilithrix sp.]MCW5816118.1 nucleotidyltransferase domain-containing protein [Labilithrix sp.]